MQQTRPTITVLIPTFNRSEYLAECLDSFLAQTLPPSQIIVVNDGSTDRTQSVLEPYMQTIDYLEAGQLGRAGAINRGFEVVRGDYLWVFDDDDVALPDALERLVDPLERHPEHGFSFGPFLSAGSRPSDGRIGAVLDELKIPKFDEKGFLIPLLECNFLCGAALFARTSCYERVGLFDPDLLRAQDYEIGVRFARQFTGVQAPGGPTFYYRQHDGMRGPTSDRFAARDLARKWLEYDQITFRKLRHDLSLAELLPPGTCVEDAVRRALLQRLVVMATKLLIPEACSELHELARLSDHTPLSEPERSLVRMAITRVPYYGLGNLFDHIEFFTEVGRLSAASPVIRLVRGEIARTLLLRFRKFGLRRMLGIPRRLLCMYAPGSGGR